MTAAPVDIDDIAVAIMRTLDDIAEGMRGTEHMQGMEATHIVQEALKRTSRRIEEGKVIK
jgi:hypothetical protein